eukprot:5809089-Heterocapsa_arctica.AAC.1
MHTQPDCLWASGVITKDWTTLEDTVYINADDVCHPCTEHTKKVYVDGSATTIGASSYAGW